MIKTYPAMNEKIKELLRLDTVENDPVSHYAAQRLGELESALNAVRFCIVNNGCDGQLSDDDYCKFCFMRAFCEVEK